MSDATKRTKFGTGVFCQWFFDAVLLSFTETVSDGSIRLSNWFWSNHLKMLQIKRSERWQSGLMHTPGKREYPKGIGGSNPPLSATDKKPRFHARQNPRMGYYLKWKLLKRSSRG